RVELRLRRLGRLDRDVAVAWHARPGRDELTEDDVLLEAEQRVTTTAHRGLREHARRLLEGRRRQPRLRRERRLRDAHELRTTGGRTPALGDRGPVGVLEARTLR